MDQYDRLAAYSRIMDSVDSLRDIEINEDMDSLAFQKLDDAFQALEDAKDAAKSCVWDR